MKVSYRQAYGDYTIVVQEIVQGRFDLFVLFNPPYSHNQTRCDLESYENEFTAKRAAEQFPAMYDVAKQEGFRLIYGEFRHPDGREVHVSYSLDLDRSPDNFRRFLQGKTL
ncbi:hypothetical protein [Effusibacillus consociatus]|uniref:Uncharacterized protein n=1 Tax=Effusibacillus consociatus TaxID=1117041 RepID=A0ABV9Q3H7_9BACL